MFFVTPRGIFQQGTGIKPTIFSKNAHIPTGVTKNKTCPWIIDGRQAWTFGNVQAQTRWIIDGRQAWTFGNVQAQTRWIIDGRQAWTFGNVQAQTRRE